MAKKHVLRKTQMKIDKSNFNITFLVLEVNASNIFVQLESSFI